MNNSYVGPTGQVAGVTASGPQGRIDFVEDEARRHLEVLFGWWDGPTSYVLVAYGRGQGGPIEDRTWKQRAYQWPAHVDILVEHARGAVGRGMNVYITPNLLTGSIVTASGDALGGDEHLRSRLRCLHFDLDGDHDDDAVDRLRDAGALLVASGSGDHAHAYMLTPVALDHGSLRRWADRLKVSLGAPRRLPPSGVLRLAGTGNFKPHNDGTPVRILTPSSDAQVSPEAMEVLADFGADRVVPINVKSSGGRSSVTYSRSEGAYQLWCCLWEDGYEPEEAYWYALAAAQDPSDLYYDHVRGAINKFGDGDVLLADARRSIARRVAKATDTDIKMHTKLRAERLAGGAP